MPGSLPLSPSGAPLNRHGLQQDRHTLRLTTLAQDAAERSRDSQPITVHWTPYGAPQPAWPPLTARATERRTVTGTAETGLTFATGTQRTVHARALSVTDDHGAALTITPEVAVLLEAACHAWLDRHVSQLGVFQGAAVTERGWQRGRQRSTGAVRRSAHLLTCTPSWTETHVTLDVRDLQGGSSPPERWLLPWRDLPDLCVALHGLNRAYLQDTVPELISCMPQRAPPD